MTIQIRGKGLRADDVVAVARFGEKVELASDALDRIKTCRKMVETRIQKGTPMYGINTGIGNLVDVILTPAQQDEFQKYLIYNHAAGIGEPFPLEIIRAAMLSRANVHAIGLSGCRPEITQTFVEMLNKQVTPVVCTHGSVGACGDLAPMSQLALVMLGEGEAFYRGERLSGIEAFRKAGIPVPGLKPRDGLSSINGSNVILGIGCLQCYDIERWLKQAEIAAAMSLEALKANMRPYQERLHKERGFPGAIASAKNLRTIIDGSDLIAKVKTKLQDAYSMRSTPQVIGAVRDQLHHTRKQFEIELNGAADNPLFVPDEDVVYTGANFQATPISMPLDTLGAAVAMVSVLSERRLNRLLNEALSQGLPPFLTSNAGLFSGFMLSQYTADMLIVEQRTLSQPAFVQSIPAAADQEDFVSMGMNTAHKNHRILENGQAVLGIEFMAAAQAIDFREFKVGKGTKAAHGVIRKHVTHLEEDRPLFKDHNTMAALVKSLEILKAVEETVGPLEG
ncbi:MAG: aromatic amino acid ammonia-lyase [Pseudomonadota bacterium]